MPVVVTVTQDAVPLTLLVSPPNQNVIATAGSTAFTVASNADWTVASDAAWCTLSAPGTGNGTIVADYAENITNQDRVATISVTVASLPVQTVTVSQARSSIGIDEQSINGPQIYPNPNKGIFRIVTGSETGLLNVTVQDMNGKIFLKKQYEGASEYKADLSSAPQGTYNIVLQTGNQLVVRKLVILK